MTNKVLAIDNNATLCFLCQGGSLGGAVGILTLKLFYTIFIKN